MKGGRLNRSTPRLSSRSHSKIGRLYLSFTNLYFQFTFFMGTNGGYSFFCSLPFVRNMPKEYKIVFYVLAKFISVLLLSKLALTFGYLFMEDLQRAAAQFLSSGSGGLAGGSAPIPGSPGSGGSSGIPNSFSWFHTHESPGQEVTSSREHVGSAEAGPSGTNDGTPKDDQALDEPFIPIPKYPPLSQRIVRTLRLQDELEKEVEESVRHIYEQNHPPLNNQKEYFYMARDLRSGWTSDSVSSLRKLKRELQEKGGDFSLYKRMLRRYEDGRRRN